MHLLETIDLIQKNFSGLSLKIEDYDNSSMEKRYFIKETFPFRETILTLERSPYLSSAISKIKSTKIFQSSDNTIYLGYGDKSKLDEAIVYLESAIDTLFNYYRITSPQSEEFIKVKLPETENLDALIQYAKLLKRGIEIPVLESKYGSEVKVLTAEPGSVWLTLAIGGALILIAKLCYAAAVIKRKWAEAEMAMAHVKTLEIKNELMQNLVDAQKQQMDNILTAEARSIQNNHFDKDDPETLNRLKLSIESIAELIDKGGKILPSKHTEQLKEAFPNYDALNTIESTIKQIGTESTS
ncbi:MAG: hypothetical protein QHC79_09415 [Pseudosphingobacterium sp.]|nr:hypothetical protein [Pseudosphingobacterium sp.]